MSTIFVSWSSCEDIKAAIENCQPISCDFSIKKYQIKNELKIIGIKNNFCILETNGKTELFSGDLGQVCHYKKSSLKIAAEVNWLGIELQKIMIDLMNNMDQKATPNPLDYTKPEEDILKLQQKLEKIGPQLLAQHDGKNPCVPKNIKDTEKVNEGLAKIVDALKPIALLSQPIDNQNYTRIFSEEKPACLLTTSINHLNDAHHFNEIKSFEDCKKLEKSNCSSLLQKTSLKNLLCPIEMNILWADNQKINNAEKISLSVNHIATKICEPNGIMREKTNLTFDQIFAKTSSSYCQKINNYQCRVRLLIDNSQVELDSKVELFKDRDGVEIKCLKLAKMIAYPHCENSKQKIYADVFVSIDNRSDLGGVLLRKTYPNICFSQKLKKYFN
jgi:hypothetical protein